MGKKIMIVDDSTTIRESVSYILGKAGYEVLTADDGPQALSGLNQKFDLVITDLNMPQMDGIELIRQVRTTGMNRFTPILMLTTESDPAKKTAGKAAGATGWIVKPFQPESFLAVVEKVLR